MAATSIKSLSEKFHSWWADLADQWQTALLLMAIFLGYLLITLVLVWPVPIRMGSAVPGPQSDQFEKMFILWQTKDAVLSGQNPMQLDRLAYPDGAFSAIRFSQLVMFLLALPVTALFGPVVAYNTFFLLSFALTALCCYLLCYDITGNRAASLMGGLVLMCFPLRVMHAYWGHVEFASLYPILLAMLALRSALRQPGHLGLAAVTGVLIALAVMFHITFAPYIMIWLFTVYVGSHLWQNRPRGSVWLTLGVIAVVSIMLILPFYVPLVPEMLQPSDRVLEGGKITYAADLLSYISPSPQNPLLLALNAVPAYAQDTLRVQATEVTAYLGIVPVGLAIAALWSRRPESFIWALLLGIGAIYALGPFLKIRGEVVTITIETIESRIVLPYAGIGQLPLFDVGRTTGRANLLTGIALAILAAQGAAAWLESEKPDLRWRYAALVLATMCIVADYLQVWPLEMQDTTRTVAVDFLTEMPPDGAVLMAPTNSRHAIHTGMFYQYWHRWPLVAGYLDRTLPRQAGVIETYFWYFDDVREETDIVPSAQPETLRSLMADDGIIYVFLNREAPEDTAEVAEWLEDVTGGPVASDLRSAIFAVGEAAPPQVPVYALDVFSDRNPFGYGWGRVETWDGRPARWLSTQGRLILYTPQATEGLLRFRALSGDKPRSLQVELNRGLATTLVIAEDTYYAVPLSLDKGYNVISFRSLDPCWNVSGDAQCSLNRFLSDTSVAAEECWLADPGPERCLDVLFQDIAFAPLGSADPGHYQPVNIALGDSITLAGYTLPEESFVPGETITLTLVWESSGQSVYDYNFFVHVLNASTRELVAQYDGAPLREAYVTTRWEAGERVTETVHIALPAETEPGDYTLLVGMYNLFDFARLPVIADRPFAADGLVWLQDISVR